MKKTGLPLARSSLFLNILVYRKMVSSIASRELDLRIDEVEQDPVYKATGTGAVLKTSHPIQPSRSAPFFWRKSCQQGVSL
jgi:hypothetical protein